MDQQGAVEDLGLATVANHSASPSHESRNTLDWFVAAVIEVTRYGDASLIDDIIGIVCVP